MLDPCDIDITTKMADSAHKQVEIVMGALREEAQKMRVGIAPDDLLRLARLCVTARGGVIQALDDDAGTVLFSIPEELWNKHVHQLSVDALRRLEQKEKRQAVKAAMTAGAKAIGEMRQAALERIRISAEEQRNETKAATLSRIGEGW